MSHALFFRLRESSNPRPKGHIEMGRTLTTNWASSSIGSESAPHFNMSLWSWVRALTEVKEKGMGHAPIACEWDHPSSEWARGWGPYKKKKAPFIVKAPPPGPLRRGVVPLTGYRGMSLALFFRLRESSNPRPKGHIEMGSPLTTNWATVRGPPLGPLRRGVVPLIGYRGMSLALFFRLRESSNPRPKGHIEMGSTLTTN